MAQAFFERAAGGSTLMAYTVASENPWFTSGLWARSGFGLLFAAGYAVLVIDLLRKAQPQEENAPARAAVAHAQPEPA
jgi:nitric oxide reductase subunit B